MGSPRRGVVLPAARRAPRVVDGVHGACWPRAGDDRWQAVAAAAFGLNALRLVARLLGGYAGVTPLAALSGPLYVPAIATVLTLLLAWFWRQAAAERASLNGSAR